MKRIIVIAILSLCAIAHAQTPAELDDYFAKKAVAEAANQVAVRANASAVALVITMLTAQEGRLVALENKLNEALATLKILQAQPGITTQQVIDALVAKLSAP